jgi:L-lysine 2,3-aminomutase
MEQKFAASEIGGLIAYLRDHTEVSDVLFTGGDPMAMSARALAAYVDPLLNATLPAVQNIRIGTKSLSFWPYRFTTDKDADDLLRLFERIVRSGKHLTIMAHFTHIRELETRAVERAINRIHSTGAQIRTQAPLMKHINDDPQLWAAMWRRQVHYGMVPYYMFIARDTGAQHYFAIPLVNAWRMYRSAYQRVSGIARTVRGPVMSTDPGKVQVLGTSIVNEEKVLSLQFLQARNPNWVRRPFFARHDSKAIWLNELRPAFGARNFFFETDGLKSSSGRDLGPVRRFDMSLS